MANAIGGYGSAKKPGDTAPPGKVAIIDRRGRYRGHVGPKASAASLWHWGVKGPARIGEFKNRPAWIEGRPSHPTRSAK